MGWNKEYQELLGDLRACHWEDYSDEAFNEIAKDLKKTFQRYGKVDYRNFPPDFRWHLCSSRLSQGKFHDWDGWEFRSDWSITFQGWNGFNMKVPKWNGKPVNHLVISSEQGIGDEICYGSAIPELIVRLGPKALELQCHPRLIPVFERSYGIKCVPRKVLSQITEGDAVVALGDLFMFYRRDKSHFPRKPFIKVDPEKRAKWLEWLSIYPKPWVGIAWKSRHGEIDPYIMTGNWPERFGIDPTFFSLQYGESAKASIETGCDPQNDMDDHLALVSCMDRIVTVTQTLAHEAGCLGVECDAIKPPKGTGETNAQLWYYGVGKSPHDHFVYGNMRVWESMEEYAKFQRNL